MKTLRFLLRRGTTLPATFLLLAATLFADYRFETWTTENGLPDNSIWALRQTRDGYLWMTTSSAMVRFDGVRFVVFDRGNTPGLTATGFSAYALAEDRDGCLWAGTFSSGVVRNCGGTFRTFTSRDGLPDDRIHRVDLDGRGVVWLYTAAGPATWRNGRIVAVTESEGLPLGAIPPAPVAKVGVDGHLFGIWRTGPAGWRLFSHGRWNDFPLPKGAENRPDLGIESIVEDSAERLWYKFRHDPGTYYSLYRGRLTTYSGFPPHLAVSYGDSDGNLWTSAHDATAALWRDGALHPLAGFGTSYVFRALEDREGSLWLGTREGLHRASRAAVSMATARNPRSPELNAIEAVLEDRDGSIWYGSHGLFHLAGGHTSAFYHRGAAPRPYHAGGALGLENIVCALFQDTDGTLWVGTWDGVARLSGGVLVSDGPSAGVRGRVNAIGRDAAGNLWIGGDRGLFRVAAAGLTRLSENEGFGGDSVQAILLGTDGLLRVGATGGLYVQSGETFRPVEALRRHNVTSLYEDRDRVLWVGAYGEGLFRIEGARFTRFSMENGLSTRSVFQIVEDRRGYLWLSSHIGIHRVRKADLNEFAHGRAAPISSTGFGRTDGMDSAECAATGQPTGVRTRDGKLWFPTADGLAVIDPEAAPVNPHPPPVLIEAVAIDGVPAAPREVLLKPGQNRLDIEYTAASFVHSGQLLFRYRLEGLDENWVEAGTRRTAYFSRLPPGDYRFHVVAANSDGLWNTAGATLALSVRPPYYRTWWFEALAALSAASLAAAFLRYRESRLKRANALQQAFARQLIAAQEDERRRIAAELHDSLGQRLAMVKNLALLFLRAHRDANSKGPQIGHIETISTETALAIDETREISYNLRPFQLDRLGLTKAIEGLVRTASAASATNFSTRIDDVDDAFPEDLRINFYRIVQESVNNIVRHARASEASIEVVRTPRSVTLTVGDNGRGFAPASPKSDSEKGGFGLRGMDERARSLGGELTVRSAPGRGAAIVVVIRIAEAKR